jgi:hypothetical protein
LGQVVQDHKMAIVNQNSHNIGNLHR